MKTKTQGELITIPNNSIVKFNKYNRYLPIQEEERYIVVYDMQKEEINNIQWEDDDMLLFTFVDKLVIDNEIVIKSKLIYVYINSFYNIKIIKTQ